MSRLVIEDQRGRRTNIPLKRGTVTVGRKEGSTIRLNERNVSRRHLELRLQAKQLVVVDRSRYGSRLNGVRFSGRTRLFDGDVLEVGDYKLLIELEEMTPTPRPNVHEAWLDYGIARLVRLDSGVDAQTLRIDGPVMIGSGEAADIRVDQPSVLSAHCRFEPQDDHWLVEVCDPATTVKINGKPVQRRRLQRGDRLQLGDVSYRWTPESVWGVSVVPHNVGKVRKQPRWHSWVAIGMMSPDALDGARWTHIPASDSLAEP